MTALAIERAPAARRDDEEILASLQRRDPTAAEILVSRYGDRAYRLAIGITRTAQDAEEVVQDAFWNVVQKIETFRGDSAFGSWLYRIVANAAYQKLRGRTLRRAAVSLDEVLPVFHEDEPQATPIVDWSPSIDDPSRRAELRIALNAAIDELPPDHRAVVVRRDVEGLSMAEVAEALAISVPNAKSRLHRARLFLRDRLAVWSGEARGPSR